MNSALAYRTKDARISGSITLHPILLSWSCLYLGNVALATTTAVMTMVAVIGVASENAPTSIVAVRRETEVMNIVSARNN